MRMASPTQPAERSPEQSAVRKQPQAFGKGYLFGVPLKDLGWFASLLMGLATGFAAFFLATFVGIVSILILNAAGHKVDYAISYKWVGLPFGVLMAVLALSYLALQWTRRITRSA